MNCSRAGCAMGVALGITLDVASSAGKSAVVAAPALKRKEPGIAAGLS